MRRSNGLMEKPRSPSLPPRRAASSVSVLRIEVTGPRRRRTRCFCNSMSLSTISVVNCTRSPWVPSAFKNPSSCVYSD